MSPERVKTSINVSFDFNETLHQFLSRVFLSNEDKEVLISLSDHQDVLKRVFIFDLMVNMPNFILEEFNYNPTEEAKIIEENLNIKMSVLFKSLGE